VAGIAIGMFLQVVLVLCLSVPEIAGGYDFGYDFAGPFARDVQFCDKFFRGILLGFIQVKNCGTIGSAHIIALSVSGCGIVDLEKIFQQFPVRKYSRIENNFNTLCMRAMVAVGSIGYIATGIAHHSRNHTGLMPHQFFNAPETATGQYCLFSIHVFIGFML